MEMKQVSTKPQKTTPIDFIENGTKRRLPGLARTRLVKHGFWAIDKVRGKTLCLIEILIPELGIEVNFTPAESFKDDLLHSWLDAERQNDEFPFDDPAMNATRPSQLRKKIEHLQKLLGDYWRAYCQGEDSK